jgi:hypothetical protein
MRLRIINVHMALEKIKAKLQAELQNAAATVKHSTMWRTGAVPVSLNHPLYGPNFLLLHDQNYGYSHPAIWEMGIGLALREYSIFCFNILARIIDCVRYFLIHPR